MVKQEVILECFALCVASLLAMTSALGDITLMHPINLNSPGLFMHDIDMPDTAFISASPFGGGSIVQSVDLGDSFYSLGGGLGPVYGSPMMNAGLGVMPPYAVNSKRRMSYPVRSPRRYGRSRRMRLVPV